MGSCKESRGYVGENKVKLRKWVIVQIHGKDHGEYSPRHWMMHHGLGKES